MLNKSDAEKLLSKLCIELGFCLKPDDDAHLTDFAPDSPKKFADAVFIAEGLVPENADRHLYRRVLTVVTEAFQEHE